MRSSLIYRNWLNSQGSYSPEATAVFSRMPDSMSTGLKNAIATWVDSQVASGNYDKIIDFGYVGLNTTGNSFTSFKGVASPVNQGTAWNSYEGFTTDGVATYMSFGFIPNNSVDFALNDCAIGAYLHVNQSTGATANAMLGVIETAVNTRQLLIQQTGTGGTTLIGRINVGNSNITYASDNIFDNESFYAVRRTASNICALLKDGAVLQTAATVSSTKAQISPFLGGRSSDGALSIPIKASFRYWVLYKPVGFNDASFVSACDQLIADIEYSKLRVLALGDSIARGTSNGTTSATEHTLKEWNGTNLIDISGDVAAAVTGSMYPSMADTIFSSAGRVTHIINTAEGGSEFSPNGDTNNWSTTGTRYALMKTKANNYLATQPAGTVFDFIKITLGVNDAVGSADLATIRTDAISLIDRLNVDFPGSKILINQLGRSTATTERETSVRATISELVSTYANVYAGTDLNTYPAEAFYDGIHLTQAYNNTLGQDDAIIMNGLL